MRLKTRVQSLVMRRIASERAERQRHARAAKRRQRRGEAPAVHYFHQVDDPYSHLAVQKLDGLREAYRLPFQIHLVSAAGAAYQGSAEHFGIWARNDAMSIAEAYGVHFAPKAATLSAEVVSHANAALIAALDRPDFADTAYRTGEALWGGEVSATHSGNTADHALTTGNALRESLGHYQGAMFYFDGDWYWGVDRLRLLEARLIDQGLAHVSTPTVPEPSPRTTDGRDASAVQLEYFPSLRSPYTAIGHQRVLELVARTGVRLALRPVMPMMMRGVPAPRPKQLYIMRDAAREGRAHGTPFGRIVDPFGPPVERAFALLPGAVKLGKDLAFITAYLQAAWFDGIDITSNRGLKQVVQNAGIDWDALMQATQGSDWQAILSANLEALTQANLWGVPSFRVSGGSVEAPFACWGQDRIWRVEDEISRRI